MSKSTPLQALATVLFLYCISLNSHAQGAAVAGRVVFATGNPVATDTAGVQRSLNRGDDIFAGDDLRTPVNSRLQVSFVDGAYISLQPDSEYEIEEYKYAGRPDGSESAVYRLLKGGVRAVTGLIGKEKPEAYKVHTAVATIGIRGTGHNTRICQGDCAGRKDGLYHNTWEGTTYVRNDVAEVNVPAGRGVFVRALNAPIQFLSQPSSVTAVETAGEREEEVREQEEETTIVSAGDQRTETGTQTVVTSGASNITPTTSTVLLNYGVIAVLPNQDDFAAQEPVDIVTGTNTSVFINDNKDLVGILTLEEDEDFNVLVEERVLGTIDPAAVLGGDDPASVSEASALLATADPLLVEQFRANPAQAADTFVAADGVGWGRWTGGNILVIDENGITELEQLVDNQSIHFVFGPEPPNIPTMGSASYNFAGGTRSTSASGATIGQGAVGGFIGVDFGNGDGFINMDVVHNNIDYFVSGGLVVDTAENSIFDQFNNMSAFSSDMNSGCYPSCPAFIDGGFAGPDNNGAPQHIGIEYDIRETDVIMGVAAFELGSF